MIPERNIFREKVSLLQRRPLYDELSDLIKTDPNIVYLCKTVRNTMTFIPEGLAVFREKTMGLKCFISLHVFVALFAAMNHMNTPQQKTCLDF